MEQSKYEIKLRERAEEFAKATYPGTYHAAIELLVKFFTPAAILSLQLEADAYRKGFENGIVYDNPFDNVGEKFIKKQLKSLGLMP